MSSFEPGDTLVEALRRANPVPAVETSGRRDLPSAHALFAEIVAQPPTRARSRVRTRVIVIAIAIVLIAVVLAAFVFVRRASPKSTVGTTCYGAAALDAPRIVAAPGTSPAAACAPFWTNGEFGTGSVPNFDVCVLPSGLAAVFPGESGSVCPKLGLPEASGNDTVAGFVYAVNRQVSSACIGFDAADQIIENALSQRGLEGWTVKLGSMPFTPTRPCASLAIAAPRRTILVIAVPNPFPSSSP